MQVVILSLLYGMCGIVHIASGASQTPTPAAASTVAPGWANPNSSNSTGATGWPANATAVNSTCSCNQTYSEYGVSCATCAKPDGPCSMNHAAGCFCDVGYVRAANGTCKSPKDCTDQDKCGENETYASGDFDCFTCRNLRTNCTRSKVEKCYCNVGYVRDDSNRCVKIAECPNP